MDIQHSESTVEGLYAEINRLSDELNLVNTERHALQQRVWELEEENARLSAELFATDEWRAEATAPLHTIAAERLRGKLRGVQLQLLGVALAVKDFKLPRLRVEW